MDPLKKFDKVPNLVGITHRELNLTFSSNPLAFTNCTYPFSFHTYPFPFLLVHTLEEVEIREGITSFGVLLNLLDHEQMNIYLHKDSSYLQMLLILLP